MSTRMLLAALAGAVASFLLGWLVYGVLLEPYYMAHTITYEGLVKNPPVLWAIFVAGFCTTLLMAYIFDKWANIRTFAGGAMAGAWIAFLIILSFDLSFHAFYNLYPDYTVFLVDVVVGTIFNGIIGGVVALVLGMGKKTSA